MFKIPTHTSENRCVGIKIKGLLLQAQDFCFLSDLPTIIQVRTAKYADARTKVTRQSRVDFADTVLRGYENPVEKLTALGAHITRMKKEK